MARGVATKVLSSHRILVEQAEGLEHLCLVSTTCSAVNWIFAIPCDILRWKMSLRPRIVNFDETWAKIRETLESVVTLKKIPRSVWNDRFSYPFQCFEFEFLMTSRLLWIIIAHWLQIQRMLRGIYTGYVAFLFRVVGRHLAITKQSTLILIHQMQWRVG